jgi:uncharacterized protein YcbK (DUF882 family)
MGDATRNFSFSEFKCSHCGSTKGVDIKLIEALQKLRDITGKTITVTSGWRCPNHSLSKASPTSQHVKGIAADIRIKGLTVKQMYEAALMVPEFEDGGIGLYTENFIHVDVRDGKARWSRINGVYTSIEKYLETR